jgi:hypothetical protein
VPQRLTRAAASAIKAEILGREQVAFPEQEISVTVGMVPNEDGTVKVHITRSRKSI